ncbi:hypothetical protein [Pedobacter duraquae]|uniref:Uncharacterized protein n=1 Tax=Pedobacter duraquae TaxID=425511 RepID=A0A4R6IF06_9SPHI|nr:hypothetical protein [Pedobacter duraquae]TDO20903.1 hypothetical protein CLV32_3538 [Pedobacter duraquae]
MKKSTVTPLLIIAAISLLIAICVPFIPDEDRLHRSGVNVSWIIPLLLVIAALIAWGTDHLVKKYTIGPKKVWMIEGLMTGFIILYAFLMR